MTHSATRQEVLAVRLERELTWQEIVDEVRYRKDVANHSGPESCSDAREDMPEALTLETGKSGIEPRNP